MAGSDLTTDQRRLMRIHAQLVDALSKLDETLLEIADDEPQLTTKISIARTIIISAGGAVIVLLQATDRTTPGTAK